MEIPSAYGVAALAALIVVGIALLLTAVRGTRRRLVVSPISWSQYRFGFPTYALIFLSFDMEMIFMYPWAVVFGDIGVAAFADMLVFIALLASGIAYAWGMGGFEWE